MPEMPETRIDDLIPEEAQQLEQSPDFARMVEKLIPVFYDLPAKRSVLSSLRTWAEKRLKDMAEDDRERCIDALQGQAITNALPRALRPEKGEKIEIHSIPNRQRRAGIIHSYPYPIAITLRRATEAPNATNRFLALLDVFETLVYFLTFTQLSQYFTLLNSELQTRDSAFRKAKDGLNAKLTDLLIIKKKPISLGDWVDVSLSLTRFFRGVTATLIFPELPSFFSKPKGAWTRQAEVFRDFVRIRNACVGHRHGRSEEYYEEICPSHFDELFSLLDSMRFLEGMEMIIPTRLKGRQISQGLVLVGDLHLHDDHLSIEVKEDELPENGGLIRLNRSVILRHETRGYVELFPYFRYQDSPDSLRRGIYFLAEFKWAATPSGRPELKKVSFVKLNATSDQKEDDPDARVIIQRMFEPILAASFAAAPSDAREDPEQRIDLVWREKDERLRVFVGRTQEKLAVLNRIESARNGLILVTGGPGSGKSSFVYHLYDALSTHCPLLHSIKKRDPNSNRPEKYLRALIYQCSIFLDRPLGESAYSGSVVGLSESLLHWAEIVAKERGGRCTVIVDGLDELMEEPHSPEAWDEAVGWLPFCTNFPEGVVFVVSAQPDQALLSAVRRRVQDRLLLTQNISSLTQDDVAKVLAGHLGEAAKTISAEDIFRLTSGYPLFLMTVIKILKSQMESWDGSPLVLPPDLLSFPREEYGYMEEIWSQIRRGKDRRLQRMTEYLCCAYEPGLSLAGLRCLLEQWTVKEPMDMEETRELLSSLSQFFIETSPDRYLPFHPCWSDYVQKTVLGQDLSRRHREMTSIPTAIWTAADREYWSLHITAHAENAGLDDEHTRAIINDDQLLKARLDLPSRGGFIHGVWLRDRTSRMSQEETGGLERRLLETWGKESKERLSLSYSQKLELGALFRAFERRSLLKEAKALYQELYEERRDPQCLMNKAWVCYQGLDEWEEAKEALKTCARIFGELGDDLGAARCMARLALLLFDQGIENPAPEALLWDSIKEFERLNQQRDEVLARETLGVVIDAEGRWDEALSQYNRALHTFEILQNPMDLGRAYLNRSVARLFLEGVKGAIKDLDRAEQIAVKQKTGQLRDYYLVNRCVVELLQNHRGPFQRLAVQVNSEEKWLLDMLRQNVAIQTWFYGDHEAALAQFERLLTECLQDAWSDATNRINMAFLMVHRGAGGDREKAVELFDSAYRTCESHTDRLGLALAAEGLRCLGHSDRLRRSDLDFYRNHLERLYVQCPSPFLPCYVLLGQPYD